MKFCENVVGLAEEQLKVKSNTKQIIILSWDQYFRDTVPVIGGSYGVNSIV